MNRFRISESERNQILDLHKNLILNEQTTTPPAAIPTNYTIKQLQELLNSKGFNVGIADGKAGAKTLAGIQQALAAISKIPAPTQQPIQQKGEVQTQQQVVTPGQTGTQVNVAPQASYGFQVGALGGTATPTAPGVS